ncbi:MAG: cell division protein FtsA [Syntrophomonas sp.]|uniref:cell division protein FtsA n=1 Tax=Syntrophomonas sp. TaxID=2053627 RepID=UPI00263670F8|nr:cell division protein FtsA [Syntrophomonas sp.]MDD2509655.1 cell division protein FtsA [Syntrophomonas sp.]MDD3878490.1 cell division protein FtsA [Syntrophomonas sp.]MDD4625683.1 cell division protein FtsA [Syntrophomonas sp.]
MLGINRNIVVALDVGTSFIKAAMAEFSLDQEINILGVSQVPSLGLRKGNIVDIESTARSIDSCLNDLERLTGVDIASTLLGFSGSSVYAINNHAVVAVGNPSYEITQDDRQRVLQSACNIALPPDKTIVQAVERQYIVDGYDGVKDPIGMVGSRLELETTIIVAATAAIQNMHRSMQRINLQLEKIVYNPLLVAEAVLLPTEKEMGVVLVDFGGGTTEISFFEAGSLLYTSVLPVGGEYITRDLAIVLRTSLEEATKIKERNAVAMPQIARNDVMINVKNVQGKETRQVSQEVVAEIISARVMEIVEMIYAELKQFGCLDRIPGGIVVTGGEAELSGLVTTIEDYGNIPTRLGIPENLRGIPVDFNRPQNAVILGGLIYSSRYLNINCDNKHGLAALFDQLSRWFKELFR